MKSKQFTYKHVGENTRSGQERINGGSDPILEQRYIFSGNTTQRMADFLVNAPQFEPIDILVSQLDRHAVKKALEYIEQGVAKSLFIDSGAYSIHSLGFEKVSNGKFATKDEFIDEYIEYVNGFDDNVLAVAQVDTIPGVFKKPKSPEDYVESAELSWQNFLYMYPKMKSPDKLIAVFHQGESFDHLGRMLEWRDPDGNQLPYVGISPSNDRPVGEKDVYLRDVYNYIAASSNPKVKTHLFGYTSLQGLEKFPWYSCDSTSHRQRSAFCKVFFEKWGTVSLSRTREVKSKHDKMFLEVADEQTIQEMKDIVEGYGLNLDLLQEDSAARVAVDVLEIQKYLRLHPYRPEKLTRQKSLFKLKGA